MPNLKVISRSILELLPVIIPITITAIITIITTNVTTALELLSLLPACLGKAEGNAGRSPTREAVGSSSQRSISGEVLG